MKLSHRIYLESTNEIKKYLSEFNINIEAGYSRIDISDHTTFLILESKFIKWKASIATFATFDKSDLNSAEFLQCSPTWQPFYPMPDNDGTYLERTFDLSNYCDKCGIGRKQNSPFRIKQIPNWGKKKSFMLFWIYDAVFVTQETYDLIFKPLDIISIPVLLHRKEIVIENVVQLDIPKTDHTLNLEGFGFEVCPECNRKKYTLIRDRFFPSFNDKISSEPQIFMTQEYFSGGGTSTNHHIIVTQALKKILEKEKVNFGYYPTAPSE